MGIGSDDSAIDGTDPAQVQEAIGQFVPGATVRMCDSHSWSTDPYAKGTWTAYGPGQLSRYYSDFFVPHGRLYFGGSDLARGWAGFMAGPIESGAEPQQPSTGRWTRRVRPARDSFVHGRYGC